MDAAAHLVAAGLGERVLAHLRSNGVQLIDERPRIGVGGTRMAFVHPKGTFGVLTELVELPDEGG